MTSMCPAAKKLGHEALPCVKGGAPDHEVYHKTHTCTIANSTIQQSGHLLQLAGQGLLPGIGVVLGNKFYTCPLSFPTDIKHKGGNTSALAESILLVRRLLNSI